MKKSKFTEVTPKEKFTRLFCVMLSDFGYAILDWGDGAVKVKWNPSALRNNF